MNRTEIIAELLNNAAESVIIVFFLYNIFKEKYYHGSKGIALMTVISISVFSAISFFMAVPGLECDLRQPFQSVSFFPVVLDALFRVPVMVIAAVNP